MKRKLCGRNAVRRAVHGGAAFIGALWNGALCFRNRRHAWGTHSQGCQAELWFLIRGIRRLAGRAHGVSLLAAKVGVLTPRPHGTAPAVLGFIPH